jgi:hypothetical protein
MAGQYRFKDSNGNIVAQISASVDGIISFSGSQVDFSQANTISLGEVQMAGTASNALLLDGFDSQAFAFTSSIHPFTSSTNSRLNSIETISASNISRINSLETTSASVDTLNTTQNSRLDSLEAKTGSLASTGSNTFIGTQTITGSLYISSDLIVQGSSSLQNITASAVSIGTNIINLNTANPAIRYAGLSIGDSGSIGSSGSFLYDSVQDEMIFIHRGANTTVTSSVVLMGPQTYDSIGNETYLTTNRLPKGAGNEHLIDSNISDDGTTIKLRLSTEVTGSLSVSGSITAVIGNEYLRNTAAAINNPQFQSWFNSAGTRRGYFGYGTGGSNQLEINNESGGALRFISGDTIADGEYFRMKGGGGSAEFIWYKNYSGSPSEPGFVINNRAGTTTFSHNVNGGGTSVAGNFSAANFSGTHSGTSSGTNTGDQTNINGNSATATISYSVRGGNGGSFTVGGNSSNFYPVLFGIGSSSTSRQGIAVLQIERGGYDEPGLTSIGFSTFHARFRAKADGWGYGASYTHLEQHAYTIPMMANFLQNNFSSELVVWLRGNAVYQWMSIEGDWGLSNGNPSGTSVTNAYGGQTYSPQSTNDVAGLSKWYTGWSTSRWSGNHIIDPLGGSGNRAVYSDASGQLTNSSSDITLKTNIENINYGLDSVLALRPVTYNWMNSEKMGTQKEIGFIAQEVQTHIPEVIGVNNDATLSLDYPKLTAVLTNAIKEQQVMINQLKSEVEILKNR